MTSAEFTSDSVTDDILEKMLAELESDESLDPSIVGRLREAVDAGEVGTANEIGLMMYPHAGGVNETS